jgi:hypothetical protein
MGAAASIESAGQLPPEELSKVMDEVKKGQESGLNNQALLEHITKYVNDNLGATTTAAADENVVASEALSAKVSSVVKRQALNYIVGADGSAGSQLCVDVILKLRSKMDTLKVFHSFTDASQDTLPPDMKEARVKEALSIKMLNGIHDQSLYSFESERRGDGEKIKQHIDRKLREWTKTHPVPDIWCHGYSGNVNRHINLEREPSLMGDTKDLTFKDIPMPLMVIKQDIVAETEKRTWVVAVGIKESSHLALDMAVTLARPKDTIIVLHIYNADNDGTYAADRTLEIVKKGYTDELQARASAESTYVCLDKGQDKTVAESIVEYVNESEDVSADFLVIAPRQNETNDFQVSSLTKALLVNAKTNIVVVKR